MSIGETLAHVSTVLLDFDGVVVDTEKRQLAAWHLALERCAITAGEPLVVAGRMDEEIASALTTSHEQADGLLHAKRKALLDLFGETPAPLVNGVDAFIGVCRGRLRLGITSNSSHERVLSLCAHYGLSASFEVVVAARGRCTPKPSPEVYLIAMRELRVQPSEVLAIEDSVVGLQAARAAQVIAVGLPSACPKSAIRGHADYVIDSFDQLLDIWRLH